MRPFEEVFKALVGEPFKFQREFAEAAELPKLVHVPTGLGKTAMVIVGWLWRRHGASDKIKNVTPRRLVYCLPMRVLVEQTRDNAVLWLHNLNLLAGQVEFDNTTPKSKIKKYTPSFDAPSKVAVHILMGGEDEGDWDIHPEQEAIILGTQDMLLSRALNRGYAASRSRWPIQFGLLHTDCLWVFDEIQLMGPGLATTAQLEAFRRKLGARDGHGCRSVWMSATMQKDWLKTVDFDPASLGKPLSPDFAKEKEEVRKRWKASKPIEVAKAKVSDAKGLAGEILGAHKCGTRTIVVVNTVRRACELFAALTATGNGGKRRGGKGAKQRSSQDSEATAVSAPKPRIVLLHSRFRPCDRKKRMEEALVAPPAEGTIIVSTQVIEAGVDVSATTLFTELAPWASLVQRFGRCNRLGDENSKAHVFYINLPGEKPEEVAAPYELDQLKDARALLKKCKNAVGPAVLDGMVKKAPKAFKKVMRFEHTHVIRRKDLVDLFDTTPDLAGNDIDIDRFVRDVEDSDVRVFWRQWKQPNGYEAPPEAEPAPHRDELCSAPIGSEKNPGFCAFTKKHPGKVWRWNFLDRKWEKADRITPGQVFLVHADAGGYRSDKGWDASEKKTVPPPRIDGWEPSANASAFEQWTSFEQAIRAHAVDLEDYDDDRLSRTDCWRTISDHTEVVCKKLTSILDADAMRVRAEERQVLEHAARWHDCGKAHAVFQNAIDDGQSVERRGKTIQRCARPGDWTGCQVVAKAPGIRRNTSGQVVDSGFWRRYDWLPKEGRKHFRHELASALAVLDPGNKMIPDNLRDLVAYLVAAHHGKVRLSIRSLPNEKRPDPRQDDQGRQRRFARGVWDGDTLSKTDLGGDVIAPTATLSLEPMELGLCEEEPFIGQPSWAERMLHLRDTLGPFRLAYLEAILRAADMRASAKAQQAAVQGEVGR